MLETELGKVSHERKCSCGQVSRFEAAKADFGGFYKFEPLKYKQRNTSAKKKKNNAVTFSCITHQISGASTLERDC